MTSKPLFEYRLQDPLSEVTRKERRALLAASTLAIFITETGLIPQKIEALDITFTQTDQHSLLLVIGAVIAYFLAAFVIYGLSDFLAWKLAFNAAVRERMRQDFHSDSKGKKLDEKLNQLFQRQSQLLLTAVRPTSLLRSLFEFLVPIAIAVFSLACVWSVNTGCVAAA